MKDKLKILTGKKTRLDKLRPLAKELEQSLEEWLRVELTYSSNAIEGNALTRIETAVERSLDAYINAASGKPVLPALTAPS